MTTTTTTPRPDFPVDAGIELDALIKALSGLEMLASYAGDEHVQLSGNELYGMFYVLHQQADRVAEGL
jgi:hypothetical protein